MKKVFISQPMKGLSDKDIINKRKSIIEELKLIIDNDIIILDSFFKDFIPEKNIPVSYLAKSIELLAQADIAYFGGDWENARGCKIEHMIATEYGIDVIEETRIKDKPKVEYFNFGY